MAKKMNWTPDQQKAIDARGGTLIVSAAAGSGKTAVLVERCIRRLTDTENICSADELLIVTFTRAATAEMRSRLAEAVAKKLREDPTNEHLQTQQMLLPSAQICTIDSFCGNLVRENFEQLGLSPDFRMLDETEVSVLQQAALEEVLEGLYAEQDPDFLKLVELLATGRDDTSRGEHPAAPHLFESLSVPGTLASERTDALRRAVRRLPHPQREPAGTHRQLGPQVGERHPPVAGGTDAAGRQL